MNRYLFMLPKSHPKRMFEKLLSPKQFSSDHAHYALWIRRVHLPAEGCEVRFTVTKNKSLT
jgi:hypothetical protein